MRNFAAAKTDRLVAGWNGSTFSVDSILRGQLERIRVRSRDLCRNDVYARKFLQMCETHVVGPTGFGLQVKVEGGVGPTGEKITDRETSRAIEAAFWKWAKRGQCDVTGKHSFVDLCRLCIRGAARDGEYLIRKVYGSQAGAFGFQLQLIAIDRLDIAHNEILGSGNAIRMGVEVNNYGRPVAYWIRTRHPGDNSFQSASTALRERVPAEDIYHPFISDEAEQTRGIPWMYAAMLRLNNLGGYEEAAIVAARVGAAKMGFFTTPEGDAAALSDDVDEAGDLITDAEAGVFGVLPEGYDFKSFDPEYPHGMYEPFVKACLRGVSSGIGVSYNTLSNDLEGVNFSSIRTGVLEERDNWMLLQNWMIESVLDDLFSNWLKWALLSGAIKDVRGKPLSSANFDKYNVGTWQGRRWQWVDPTKDIQANILAIQNNLKSRSDVISEQGRDPDEVFAQLAAENEQLESLGLTAMAATEPNKPKVEDSEDKPKEETKDE